MIDRSNHFVPIDRYGKFPETRTECCASRGRGVQGRTSVTRMNATHVMKGKRRWDIAVGVVRAQRAWRGEDVSLVFFFLNRASISVVGVISFQWVDFQHGFGFFFSVG